MKLPITFTAMMAFSILYFGASFIPALFPVDTNGVMEFLNILSEFHIFETCLVITTITSIYGNYKRTIQNGSKFNILKMMGLFGFDYTAMLIGVLASQFVFMLIYFSSNDSMHNLVAIFTILAIILNISRVPILNKMATPQSK